MKRVGIGIIGCGAISERAQIPAYLRTPECRLVAVSDINLDRAREIANRFGIEHFFAHYNDLLNHPDVEAVSVCTPPATHCKIVVDSCTAGKHVLCEKPIALSLQEADDMIEAATKSGIVFSVGHQFRFMPNVRRVRELLLKKIIGRVLNCYGEFSGGSVFFDWKTSSDYYMKPGSGIDVVLNYGTHLLDLFNFLFGKPLKVSGFIGQARIRNVEVSDRAVATIQYEDAFAVLNTFYTRSAAPDTNFVEIHGFDGKLSFYLDQPVISFYKRDSIVNKLRGARKFTIGERIDFLYPYVQEIRDFVESVKGHRLPYVTGQDGRNALELALAICRSCESGQSVALPLK